ncbi:hypothetical protein HanIR_Chr05g0213511 [Helianthus annuus]|nr:hypothetical protein HanIR_Chr05g0213511 [Helianthus annuus]
MNCIFFLLALCTCLLTSSLEKNNYVVPETAFFFSPCAKKATKLRVADFVHGVDGLRNQNFPQPKSKPIE